MGGKTQVAKAGHGGQTTYDHSAGRAGMQKISVTRHCHAGTADHVNPVVHANTQQQRQGNDIGEIKGNIQDHSGGGGQQTGQQQR